MDVAKRGLLLPSSMSLVIAAAWALALLANLSGSARLLHHDQLIEGGVPLWTAAIVFVLTWQVMIAAMMLPSSLPLIRLFAVASASQDRSRLVQVVFFAGYAAVWTAFGVCAFAGDVGLHRLVDSSAWFKVHAAFIPGIVLLLAGVFQFSPLKEQCLKKCRLPANFLMHHYKRGARAAFSLGGSHGLYCLGCCWALMLLGFAAGSANLAWMALLTAIMVYEKAGRYGREAARVFGTAFVVWGILTLTRDALIGV